MKISPTDHRFKPFLLNTGELIKEGNLSMDQTL